MQQSKECLINKIYCQLYKNSCVSLPRRQVLCCIHSLHPKQYLTRMNIESLAYRRCSCFQRIRPHIGTNFVVVKAVYLQRIELENHIVLESSLNHRIRLRKRILRSYTTHSSNMVCFYSRNIRDKCCSEH